MSSCSSFARGLFDMKKRKEKTPNSFSSKSQKKKKTLNKNMWISVVRKIFLRTQKKKIDSNSSTSSVVVFAPFIIIPLLWCWKETNNNNDAFDE